MARLRPKKKRKGLDQVAQARLRRKWQRWIRRISHDLGRELLNQETFVELREVVTRNPAIHSPGDIHHWMITNHIAASSLGVRRFADMDRRSISLGRLLFELLEYPGVLTREWHRTLYRTAPFMADRTFDNIAGRRRTHLGPRVVRRDLRRLEQAVDRVRRFANKRIAHATQDGAIRRPPTFADLERALSVLDELVKRYRTLLTADGYVTFKPTRQYYWRKVFFQPWIPPGSPLRAGFE